MLDREHATKIAPELQREDRPPRHVGHGLRFEVEADYAARSEPQRVGGA